MNQTGLLIIQREKHFLAYGSHYWLYVDDEFQGTIKNNQSVKLELPVGEHVVYLKTSSPKQLSQPTKILITSSETQTFKCGFTRKWKKYTSIAFSLLLFSMITNAILFRITYPLGPWFNLCIFIAFLIFQNSKYLAKDSIYLKKSEQNENL